MIETRKTKKCAGVDLNASSFAYCGDENDTSTWSLPIFAPGDDPAKTRNLIKNSLYRFADTKGIPDGERQAVWLILVGAARGHGIPAQHQAPAKSESDKTKLDAEDRQMKRVLAEGELAAERFLAKIGYGNSDED